MEISFSFLKFKILLNILRAKDYIIKIIKEENPETYKPQGISLRELAELIGVSYHDGSIWNVKPWLEKEKIIVKIGKKKVVRRAGAGEGVFLADAYDVDFEKIDSILFDKWETRILFDRAHDYIYRDRPRYRNE